jgi:3-methyladenine DNA glycosylase/8-oxoguanine DNA glycosylase
MTWRPDWPCDPYDVLRPLRRGAGDPTFQHDADGTVWRASMTPQGTATLRVRPRAGDGTIELEAWGDGAGWMLEQAPAMLGALDDISGFVADDPMVRAAWEVNPHWRVPTSGLVLEALVAAVIEQKVTGREAWTGWRRLIGRFGEPAPGPGEDRGLRTLPTPEKLALVPSWEWLRCHIDGARSATIVRAARLSSSLERTVGLPAGEVDRRLRSIPGVGVWTAAEVRQRAHGDADAVSFADYHVAKHIGFALTGEAISDEELELLLAPYRPHRYRVQHVVTTRLPGRSRRGPRMAQRSHLPG